MAHFARVVDGNVVRVHVVNNSIITDDNGVEHEQTGQNFLAGLHGVPATQFVQCSYNGNFRGRYPAAGFAYDAALDEFVAPVEIG